MSAMLAGLVTDQPLGPQPACVECWVEHKDEPAVEFVVFRWLCAYHAAVAILTAPRRLNTRQFWQCIGVGFVIGLALGVVVAWAVLP